MLTPALIETTVLKFMQHALNLQKLHEVAELEPHSVIIINCDTYEE